MTVEINAFMALLTDQQDEHDVSTKSIKSAVIQNRHLNIIILNPGLQIVVPCSAVGDNIWYGGRELQRPH